MSTAAAAAAAASPTAAVSVGSVPVKVLRTQLIAALITDCEAGFGLPVPPIVDIIAQYASSVDVETVLTKRNRPYGLTSYTDRKTGEVHILIAEYDSHTFTDFNYSRREFKKLAGTGSSTVADGAALSASGFYYPLSLAVDPCDDDRIFLSDCYSIRTYHISTGVVARLSGGGTYGYADMPGDKARYDCPTGMEATTNHELVVADYHGHRLRQVNTKTGHVCTLAGNRQASSVDGGPKVSTIDNPRFLAFDRSTAVAPYSVVWITTNNAKTVRRYDMKTGELSSLALQMPTNLPTGGVHMPGAMRGIMSTPRGLLLVSCSKTHALWSIDTTSGLTRCVAGTPGVEGDRDGPPLAVATFNEPIGLTVVDADDAVFVSCGTGHSIRRLPLSALSA